MYDILVNIEGKTKLTEAMQSFINENNDLISKLKTTYNTNSGNGNQIVELDDVVINKLSNISYVK